MIPAELSKIFVRDAGKAVATLEEIYKRADSLNAEDLRSYTINIHAMKSALALIGENGLSQTAGRLEQIGRNRSIAEIASETPPFIASLHATIERLTPPTEGASDDVYEDMAFINEKLLVIANACVLYDKPEAKKALTKLRQIPLRRKTIDFLDTIAEYLLHSDFEEAADGVRKFLEASQIK